MLKSPRAAMAIPACGVCNLRVRRLDFLSSEWGNYDLMMLSM